MPCDIYPPLGLCGYGQCINNNTCICDSGWSGLQDLINNDGRDCFLNIRVISIAWTINLIINIILLIKCILQIYSKLNGGIQIKIKIPFKIVNKISPTSGFVPEVGGHDNKVSHITQVKKNMTIESQSENINTLVQGGAGGGLSVMVTDYIRTESVLTGKESLLSRRIRYRLRKIDMTSKLLVFALLFCISSICFDLLKLLDGQLVGRDIPITIAFLFEGTGFWVYNWFFGYNLVSGAVKSSSIGKKSKYIRTILGHFRLICSSCAFICVTAFLAPLFTLRITDNWDLQNAIARYHYISLGAQMIIGISMLVKFLNKLIGSLEDAKKGFNSSTKSTDRDKRVKHEAVIKRMLFLKGQFISNATTNSILAFVSATPWMANKIEYALCFAWTAGAIMILAFTTVMV